eukprot:GEMP01078503.1.p1 GENE.GEMP01078503.1~~GEMP01078503.1.p1  ORF type:complete len:179 (+),score=38.83 GEMP01078503.1:67-603(+)
MGKLDGKKVCIFVDFQYEDMEVHYPKIRFEEEGATVHLVAAHDTKVKITGKHGYPCFADKHINDVTAKDYDALILPGGFAPDYMRRQPKMLDMITEMFTHKPIGSICHGPWMLCSAKKDGRPVISGLKCTAFVAIKDDVENAGGIFVDQAVVVDKKVVTSRTPKDLTPFCLAIIDLLA